MNSKSSNIFIRLFPQPLTSALLFAVWLLLYNTVHPAHIVLAAFLAVAIPHLTARFSPPKPHIKQPLTILILGIIVLIDIVKSNIIVARLILGREANIRPRFVSIPLDITDNYAKVALAAIITLTPGTISADFSGDGMQLLVHAFNVADDRDEAALIAEIKARYELPLKEIFQ